MADPTARAEDPTTPAPSTGAASPAQSDEPLAPKPRRETLSAFETRLLVGELQSLVGGFLEKAYQPTRDEVLLRFRAPELGRRDLYYRRGAFFCFTEHPPPNPSKPSGFAMAVRKHAGGGRVFRVEQIGYDRVVVIWVQRREGDLRIVFELFADGNCVLVRPDGRIIVSLVPEAWAARTIRGGAEYQPPPARADPFQLDQAGLDTAITQSGRDIVRALAVDVGLGGPIAEELLQRVGIAKQTAAADLDAAGRRRVWDAWEALKSLTTQGSDGPAVVYEDGRAVDFVAHRSDALAAEIAASAGRIDSRPTPTISAALDTLFLTGRAAAAVREEVAAADERLTKLERQLKAQEEAVVKFTKDIAEKALHGELLFAHYATVEAIRQSLLDARRGRTWDEIQATIAAARKSGHEDAARIVRIDPNKGLVVLRLEDAEGAAHDVPLDIRLDVRENASAAYERSKAARDKLAGAEEALSNTRARMAEAADERVSAEAAVEASMARSSQRIGPHRHHWFEAFRWMYTSSGLLVVGGRDASGNDRVVKKHLEDGDRYIHADLHGAPSVVLKVPKGSDPDDATLRESGALALAYSRAFGATGSGDAYWVTPPQVSKTPQAGEFLAKGAFIVRGERNWMRKIPLVCAVGVIWLDREGRPTKAPQEGDEADAATPRLMGGAPEAVAAHCAEWVEIVPGTMPRSQAVKILAACFGAHADAVDRALPGGDVRLVRAQGIQLPGEATP